MNYVDVLVDSGFHAPLTYKSSNPRVRAGSLVEVPFKNRICLGVVLAEGQLPASVDSEKIKSVIDHSALSLPNDLFQCIAVLRKYYLADAREIMRTLRLSLISWQEAHTRVVMVDGSTSDTVRITPLAQKIIEAANSKAHLWHIEAISPKAGSTMNRLIKAEKLKKTIDSESLPLFKPNTKKTCTKIELSTAQRAALDALVQRRDKPKLFWGDTGSGKTVVLAQYFIQYIEEGGQWLILLPEIALLEQIAARIGEATGCVVESYHGSLTEAQKKKVIQNVLNNEVQIVVGTRSAVFIPFTNLGLITVDECHDRSFKDMQSCRYHARDMAITRAVAANIPIILASATPDLDSLERVQSGKFDQVRLSERFGQGELAEVEIVDLTKDASFQGISTVLVRHLKEVYAKSRQSLVFINRKGFAPVFYCGDCSWKAECPNCSARLALFRGSNALKCHACGFRAKVDEHCPKCHGSNLIPLGLATERVVAILAEHLPHARIMRVDREVITSQEAVAAAISSIQRHEVDIIVSTQILAKSVNFENLSFVAVLDVDQGLLSLDPRASEYTGQQVIQVLGRAGRFQAGAKALIQTTLANRAEINYLAAQDWAAYSKHLLSERYLAALPPFSASLVLRGESTDERLIDAAFNDVHVLLCDKIKTLNWQDEISVTPPFAARIERVDRHYRRIIFVTSQRRNTRNALINKVASNIQKILSKRHIRWHIDVDPIELG